MRFDWREISNNHVTGLAKINHVSDESVMKSNRNTSDTGFLIRFFSLNQIGSSQAMAEPIYIFSCSNHVKHGNHIVILVP